MRKSRKKEKHEFHVIIERDTAGFYIASVPELSGCHTQARSLDVLIKRIREAIDLCLDIEKDKLNRSEFIGIQKIAV